MGPGERNNSRGKREHHSQWRPAWERQGRVRRRPDTDEHLDEQQQARCYNNRHNAEPCEHRATSHCKLYSLKRDDSHCRHGQLGRRHYRRSRGNGYIRYLQLCEHRDPYESNIHYQRNSDQQRWLWIRDDNRDS